MTGHGSANQSRQAIFVLGMHRSGTSALARVLNLLGVELGNNLLPPAADNETGFWEHKDVQSLHDEILHALNRSWATVSPLPGQWWHEPKLQAYRVRLREMAERDFGQSALWGLKDPRLCFLLPLWRQVLGEMNCQLKCVLIFRNPVEVARSLQKRGEMPDSRANLLWLRSMLDSERESRNLPRTITQYELLLTDSKEQLTRIARDLELEWPIPLEQAESEITEFLQPSLRHHEVDNRAVLDDAQLPELLRRGYATALDATGKTGDLSSAFDPIARDLDQGQPLLTQFTSDLEKEYHSLILERNHLGVQCHLLATTGQEQLAAVQAVAAHHEQRANALEQQMAAALASHQAELQQVKDALTTALRERDREIHEKEAQRVQTQAELLTTIAALDQSRAETAGVQRELAHSQAETAQTRAELHESRLHGELLQGTLQQIWQSRSWRWTSLLRGRADKLTELRLMPDSSVQLVSPHCYRSAGPAHFFLPCPPVSGAVNVKLKISSSVPSTARLYFDTGRSFNSEQFFELGQVNGKIEINSNHFLSDPVRCFRLDPVQDAAEFTIEEFEIAPMKNRRANPDE